MDSGYMSYSLNSSTPKRGIYFIKGSILGLIKRDTRSLDYSSYWDYIIQGLCRDYIGVTLG